jgi:hypothetical protein
MTLTQSRYALWRRVLRRGTRAILRPFDTYGLRGMPGLRARASWSPDSRCNPEVAVFLVGARPPAGPARPRRGSSDGVTFEGLVATVALFGRHGARPTHRGQSAAGRSGRTWPVWRGNHDTCWTRFRNDSDPDHDILRLTACVRTHPTGTAAVVVLAHDFLQHPAAPIAFAGTSRDAGYTGTDALTYTVSDGRGRGRRTAIFPPGRRHRGAQRDVG